MSGNQIGEDFVQGERVLFLKGRLDKGFRGDSHEINYRLSWPDKNIPFG